LCGVDGVVEAPWRVGHCTTPIQGLVARSLGSPAYASDIFLPRRSWGTPGCNRGDPTAQVVCTYGWRAYGLDSVLVPKSFPELVGIQAGLSLSKTVLYEKPIP
jgi:hypothetical protein